MRCRGCSAIFPFALAWTIRLLTRLPQRSVKALATIVPEPPAGRQRAPGGKVVEILPIPRLRFICEPDRDAQRPGRFSFGITADYDSAPTSTRSPAGSAKG